MDFSSANTALWAPIVQLGIIAALILLANVLRRKISFIRNSLMPTAVLAGFIMLLLRNIVNGSTKIVSRGGIAHNASLSIAIKSAVILVSSLPIILLYPFLQKYFVKGMTIGAVKG